MFDVIIITKNISVNIEKKDVFLASVLWVGDILSLYSTATQNHLCWVLALAWTPTPQFWVTYTNMLGSKNAKFALPKTRDPNVSQWNIGCVGSPTQFFCVGHVYFMLFIPGFFLRWIPNANSVLSGIWTLHPKQHSHLGPCWAGNWAQLGSA